MDSRMEKAEAMFHAYCTTETLPQLTEHASEIIGMPLHVTDHSYKLLTQANLDFAVEKDMVWRDTAELGYLSSGIIANVVRSRSVQASASALSGPASSPPTPCWSIISITTECCWAISAPCVSTVSPLSWTTI